MFLKHLYIFMAMDVRNNITNYQKNVFVFFYEL